MSQLMQLDELAASLNGDINMLLASIVKDQWDEDYITRLLVDRIRAELNRYTLVVDDEVLQLTVSAHKCTGNVEKRFGDLAVLVSLGLRDGEVLTGVATYEAKKREWDKTKLTAFRIDQARAINENTVQGRLLIYDHEPVPVRTQLGRDWLYRSGYGTMTSRANTVHLSLPLNTGRKDTSLYRFADPFAYQLCCRNLRGMDLDFDKSVVKAICDGESRRGVPRYVLAVSARRESNTAADVHQVPLNKEKWPALTRDDLAFRAPRQSDDDIPF